MLIQAASDHDVVVCNVKAYGTQSVSQYVNVDVDGNQVKYRNDIKAGRWSESPMFCLRLSNY